MSLVDKKVEWCLRKAEKELQEKGYSDWSVSAGFYCVYHCFLAILAKKGYESRNQECTFALINQMIDNQEIGLDKDLIKEIYSIKPEEKQEIVDIVELRELFQYGIKLSLEDNKFNRLLNIARQVLDKTKEEIEK